MSDSECEKEFSFNSLVGSMVLSQGLFVLILWELQKAGAVREKPACRARWWLERKALGIWVFRHCWDHFFLDWERKL